MREMSHASTTDTILSSTSNSSISDEVVIEYIRNNDSHYTFEDVVADPRKLPWLLKFVNTKDNHITFQVFLLLYNKVSCVKFYFI